MWKKADLSEIRDSRIEKNCCICYMKEHKGMRPVDVVVLLRIMMYQKPWLKKDLASDLHVSNSEVSESLNRSMLAGLIDPSKRKVLQNTFLDFLRCGLPFVFPAIPGAVTRGIPTAHSAPVLSKEIISKSIYVWPAKEGDALGVSIQPLYPNGVLAVQRDPHLYDILALVDAIRGRESKRPGNRLFKT